MHYPDEPNFNFLKEKMKPYLIKQAVLYEDL